MLRNVQGQRLTGRIDQGPDDTLINEVLRPQFMYELEHFFDYYILIEMVLVTEYERMGLLSENESIKVRSILTNLQRETVLTQLDSSMSDIAFAIERCVEQSLDIPISAWHVDRSRNDLQACAQIMCAREWLRSLANNIFDLMDQLLVLCMSTTELTMPGYTHYQYAQIISPAFYLSALGETLLSMQRRLLNIYDQINKCPLGSGAMAGQELPWDRNMMANKLGFHAPVRHALVGVASREWTLEVAAALSNFSTELSRFDTDFIAWASSQYNFIDLPERLSGISSAMPQKKNFPILERMRGRLAHVTGFYQGIVSGQRNTAYSNLVETSKETNKYLLKMFEEIQSSIKLCTLFITNVRFVSSRMIEECRSGFYGAFTLANLLTLRYAIPYRTAQVVVGKVITTAIRSGIHPDELTADLVEQVGTEFGMSLKVTDDEILKCFDIYENLNNKDSLGGTSPRAVRATLESQQKETIELRHAWSMRQYSSQSPDSLL
jgi:argininosuccinate lyase